MEVKEIKNPSKFIESNICIALATFFVLQGYDHPKAIQSYFSLTIALLYLSKDKAADYP
jgi:hypothetical protein